MKILRRARGCSHNIEMTICTLYSSLQNSEAAMPTSGGVTCLALCNVGQRRTWEGTLCFHLPSQHLNCLTVSGSGSFPPQLQSPRCSGPSTWSRSLNWAPIKYCLYKIFSLKYEFNVNRLYVCRGVLLRAQDGQQEGSQELWEDLHHPQETFREGSPGPGAQVRRRVRAEEQERGGEHWQLTI